MYNQGSFMEVIQGLRLEKSQAEARILFLNNLLEQRDIEISLLKKEIELLNEKSVKEEVVPIKEETNVPIKSITKKSIPKTKR
jgi:hypothetical protein